MKKNYKSIISTWLLGNIVLAGLLALWPSFAWAQNSTTTPPSNTSVIVYEGVEGSIQRLLCTPGISSNYAEDTESGLAGPDVEIGGNDDSSGVSNVNARDISVCVNRLYRFGAVLGSIAGVFFTALAGYIYIMGGEHSKEKAKGLIFSVIAGLVIIFTAFILLRQINPEAVKFRTIQPPVISGVPDLPTCEDLSLPGQSCLLANGQMGQSVAGGGASGPSAQSCPSGLVDVGSAFPQRGSWKICKALLDKLAQVYQNSKTANYNWINNVGIGQTFQSPTISQSSCHKPGTPQTGTCADIGFGQLSGYPAYPPKGTNRSPLTGAFGRQYAELCKEIAKVGGIKIHNEAAPSDSGCGTFANETHNSGWHLHITLTQ